MQDLISVIVPVYKVETYLDECISSLVAQTHRNLEIILVDDGSPDHCPAICDAWAEKDQRICVIHKKNGGISSARNAGIDIARGDYIAFVDSDDWISPQMYETMLQALLNSEADFCSCGIMVSKDSHYTPLKIPAVIGDSETMLSLLFQNTAFPVAAWNKLYRINCWKNIRFPVGKVCEDAMTTYLLIDQAKKIVQINNPFYYYRIRENSIMTSQFSIKRMDEEEAWRRNYIFMADHYPRLKKASFDFYLLKINILIHEISVDQRAKFSDEYEQLKNIFKKNLSYIVFSSQLPIKQRVKLLLDYCQL